MSSVKQYTIPHFSSGTTYVLKDEVGQFGKFAVGYTDGVLAAYPNLSPGTYYVPILCTLTDGTVVELDYEVMIRDEDNTYIVETKHQHAHVASLINAGDTTINVMVTKSFIQDLSTFIPFGNSSDNAYAGHFYAENAMTRPKITLASNSLAFGNIAQTGIGEGVDFDITYGCSIDDTYSGLLCNQLNGVIRNSEIHVYGAYTCSGANSIIGGAAEKMTMG